ncbi:MAG TPA: type IV pilin protein [Gammaproteobacteria bacterium]|nr:type IV pilin protein [Gammaproteobacteria bacterium]
MNRAIYSAKKQRTKGFTLIELLIVVAVIGILAAIAYPSYTRYVLSSTRTVAKSALSEAAARMETYRMDNKSYNTTDMTALGYPSDPLYLDQDGQSTTAVNSVYQIEIAAASATSYTLQAVAQNRQASDAGCKTLTLTSTGVKGSTDSSNAASTGCW